MGTQLVRVQFHGDTLDAIEADGKIWVSLRRLCENLGVDPDSQRKKLLGKPWACTVENTVQMPGSDQSRSITMVDVDTLAGWLFSVDARKVKPGVRDKLVRYQKEAARVLREYFFGPTRPPTPAGPDPLATVAAAMQQMAATLAGLADRVSALEARPAAPVPVNTLPANSRQRTAAMELWLLDERNVRAYTPEQVKAAGGWLQLIGDKFGLPRTSVERPRDRTGWQFNRDGTAERVVPNSRRRG